MPLEAHDHSFFNWTFTVIVLVYHPLWWEDGFVSYEYAWPLSSVHIAHIAWYWKCFLLQCIQVLCQSRHCKADNAYSFTSCYNGSFVTWMVISLTTVKFKPLIFSVPGFALTYAANMIILMILYDFCLLLVQFCYIILYTWKLKAVCKSQTGVHLGKLFPMVWRTLFCRRCNFKRQVATCFFRCLLLIPRQGKH
jgi:hypothetical protein